jgi:hypothetical protein
MKCSICDVPLCQVIRNGKTKSCFEEWHSAKLINNPCGKVHSKTQRCGNVNFFPLRDRTNVNRDVTTNNGSNSDVGRARRRTQTKVGNAKTKSQTTQWLTTAKAWTTQHQKTLVMRCHTPVGAVTEKGPATSGTKIAAKKSHLNNKKTVNVVLKLATIN